MRNEQLPPVEFEHAEIPEAKAPIFVDDIYYPTRLEYFAAAALQALLTSVSAKKYDQAAIEAVKVAKQIEIVLDTAQG